MKCIIQRVSYSSVSVSDKIVNEINKGFNILVGIGLDDEIKDIKYIADKISKIRIFDDADGKMNYSIMDIKGEILLISQFTLMADTRKGNRPSYINALSGDKAIKLYEELKNYLINIGIPTKTGIFGADMKVNIDNDGPVTIILDSKEVKK